MLAIARTLGRRVLSDERHWQYGNPKTNTINLDAASVDVAQSYDDRIEFKIELHSHALAMKLAKFLATDLQEDIV